MKRWMAVLLLILLPACACADVITAAGSYQACRENGEGEYLVLTREGTGAKATAYDGQDEYLWEIVFEADEGETAAWASAPFEDGWLLAGASSAEAEDWHEGWYDRFQPQSDGWLAALDEKGDLLWQRRFGGSGADTFWDVLAMEDCILLCGESGSEDGHLQTLHLGEKDAWILCLDRQGNLLWQRTFGSLGDDAFRGVAQTRQGIAAAGWRTGEDGEKLGWILQMDSEGNLLDEWTAKKPSALYDLAKGGEGLLSVGVYEDGAWLVWMDADGGVEESSALNIDISTRALSCAWYPGGFWGVGGESVQGEKRSDWLLQVKGGKVRLAQGSYEVEEETE